MFEQIYVQVMHRVQFAAKVAEEVKIQSFD